MGAWQMIFPKNGGHVDAIDDFWGMWFKCDDFGGIGD
jgi:hypothetical protein